MGVEQASSLKPLDRLRKKLHQPQEELLAKLKELLNSPFVLIKAGNLGIESVKNLRSTGFEEFIIWDASKKNPQRYKVRGANIKAFHILDDKQKDTRGAVVRDDLGRIIAFSL